MLNLNVDLSALCVSFGYELPPSNLSPYEFQKVHLRTSKRISLGELISCIFTLFYPFIHVHFHHIDQDLAMSRLHFAYICLYQVLEYHMEFLETFGCIWSSKEVIRVIFGRALPGATSPERLSQVTPARATYRSDAMNSLALYASE